MLTEALWIFTLALQALWAIRLWKASLKNRYPVLFLYLWSVTLLGIIGYCLATSQVRIFGLPGYTFFWVCTRPLVWTLLFLLVFEVYSCILEEYQGLRRLGRLVLYSALASVAVLIALLAYVDPFVGNALNRWHRFWLIVERDIYLAIAAVVFLLLMFKQWFRLATSRNVQLIFTTFGLYFSGVAAFSILRTYLGPGFNAVSNVGSILLYAVCVGLGALMFSPTGEVRPQRQFSPEQYTATAKAASRQLKTLNERLAEVLS